MTSFFKCSSIHGEFTKLLIRRGSFKVIVMGETAAVHLAIMQNETTMSAT